MMYSKREECYRKVQKIPHVPSHVITNDIPVLFSLPHNSTRVFPSPFLVLTNKNTESLIPDTIFIKNKEGRHFQRKEQNPGTKSSVLCLTTQ